MWKRTTIFVAVWLSGASIAAPSGAGEGETAGPIPAPPGPYQSSQPYLYSDDGAEPLPYYGVMQFPPMQHGRPYFGPGRYFAPEQFDTRADPRFATRPTPPWGPARPPVGPTSQRMEESQGTAPGAPNVAGAWPPVHGRDPEVDGVP